jgi:hypothetical protein
MGKKQMITNGQEDRDVLASGLHELSAQTSFLSHRSESGWRGKRMIKQKLSHILTS